MRGLRLSPWHVAQLYMDRPDVRMEDSIALRIRIGIRIIERLGRLYWRTHTSAELYDLVLRSLVQMEQRGKPHPIEGELYDLIAAYTRQDGHLDLYARARHLAAKRQITIVRYGGRKQ